MKLYFSKGACSLAIRIIVNELNIPCDFEQVALRDKKTAAGADFLAINPKGSVPVLELDDKSVLTENIVIQQYLAEKNNATQLLPAVGDMKRYRVLEWLNFISTDIHKTCSPLFNPTLAEEVKENPFRAILKTKLAIVEKHLQNNKFLMGDQFTLPDTYLFVIINWFGSLKIDAKNFPNIMRFHEAVKARPAVEKSLRDEGII